MEQAEFSLHKKNTISKKNVNCSRKQCVRQTFYPCKLSARYQRHGIFPRLYMEAVHRPNGSSTRDIFLFYPYPC